MSTSGKQPGSSLAGCGRVVSRRHLIQAGGLGLMGLSLPKLYAAEANTFASGITPRADSCIVLFLNGGPSHLDIWDMKPQAPAGIRGEFKPIATSAPGIQICEHLPRLARQMHRATLVRALHHTVNGTHANSVYASLTGHDRGDSRFPTGSSSQDYPSMGSVMSLLKPPGDKFVPHVCLPHITQEGEGGPPQPGFFGGFLGHAYDPLFVLKDPNAPGFTVPELTLVTDVSVERLEARRALFTRFDQQMAGGPGGTPYDTMDSFRRRALNLLRSETTRKSLRIGDEPEKVRERYGRNLYGQSVLLARRLIEAGTRMATVSWAPHANATWDTHEHNFKRLKNPLLPQFDAACSSLIEDLAERGMLDRTLVAVLGDFGRGPKIDNKVAGRGHWNFCYTVMLVGGGFKGGFVYGASDATGAFPAKDALVPGDIISTIYHALGVPNDYQLHDQLNRPHRLVAAGDVVHDLLV